MTGIINIMELKILTFLFPIALIALFFVIALSRCWLATMNWHFGGRDQVENDEIRTIHKLEHTKVTTPLVNLDETGPVLDDYIENLLASGRFLQAKDYVRDMRDLAREQLDKETAGHYELYDRRISRLQARNVTLTRLTA